MKSGADLFTSFNAGSDVFQIFQNNRRTSVLFRFRDNFFRYTVIYMANCTLFSARDVPQALLCCLRTFALKALSMSQKLISFCAKSSSSEQLSCGGGGQNIFT